MSLVKQVESSYPLLRGRPTREGDPICDCYCIKLYDDCQVVCLTDGKEVNTYYYYYCVSYCTFVLILL